MRAYPQEMNRLLAEASKSESPTTEEQAKFNRALAKAWRSKKFFFGVKTIMGRLIYIGADGYLHERKYSDSMQNLKNTFLVSI